MKRPSIVLGFAIVAACTPIEAVPLSNAPVNTCGCDAYKPTAAGAPECITSTLTATTRCETRIATNRIGYPIFLAISVPDSASFAPSTTYVLYTDESGSPTFTQTTQTRPNAGSKCTGARCVELSGLSLVKNEYRVAADQSGRVGYQLGNNQLIPVRVEYDSVASNASSPRFVPGLPLGPRYVTPVRADSIAGDNGYIGAAGVAFGRYRRVMYPLPPFDALFPPCGSRSALTGLDSFDVQLGAITDQCFLRTDTLDPPATRAVTVQRSEGLEGWQVWVQDTATKQRISTLKTLPSATSTTLTMDTMGERRAANGGLGDSVEVVVAPPSSYLAQPRFINPVNGGDLGTIRYPFVYGPVPVTGFVVEPGGPNDPLLGYAAHLTFESISIATPRETSVTSPLLHYSTTLATDDRGQFATVLTPGTYQVTVEPESGTSFAKSHQIVVVNQTQNIVYFRPPKRTHVTGRVLLTDGRPVVEGQVLATPQTPEATSESPKPRPYQTQIGADGGFALDLDQGPYVITASPKPGTGFPPVVTRQTVPASDTDIGTISVPPPAVFSFTVRDATRAENPVVSALVRVFAVPGVTTTADFENNPTAEAVEIGHGTTDAAGLVEILLAPGAR